MKKIILTGERPTGNLHIGHYFGALKKRVELQDEYDTYVIIADVQALTDNYDKPDMVRKNVYNVVLDNLSVGIDPDKTNIFIQSRIKEIAELTCFYSNLVTISRLYRNPTIKTEIKQKEDKFGKDGESLTYGFLGYPISQAADITAFNASIVPVGIDQVPVLEQTREIVKKFNSIYGDTLEMPEYILSENSRIKGLDGNEKMGKSLGNAIYLSDTAEEVNKKVMKAITDPNKIRKDDPGNPDICMVCYYHRLFNKENLETVRKECRTGERGCVQCKKELALKINEFLDPIREKRKYYEDNPELIDEIIEKGTKNARKKAEETLLKVKKAMKIYYEGDDK